MIEGRFVITIRKGQVLKSSELNYEREELTRILENYSCFLCFDSELTL